MKNFGGPVLFLDRNDINTDEIIPARYLTEITKEDLKPYLLEDLSLTGFDPKGAVTGSARVIVTRANFGCGSSREHAPVAIVACGVSCVVAASFARIFFRNAINIGLPIVESEEASKRIRNKDLISVDIEKGVIRNLTRKESYKFEKYPPFMQKIIKAGGLMNSIKKRGK